MSMTDTEWPIKIVCHGKAQSAGSKKSVPTPKGWRIVDDNERSKPWQGIVGAAAAEQYGLGKPLTCAVDVEMIFVMKRRKGDFGTGRNAEVLKDTAPLQPTGMPDVLKLARGVEDALTGIVWKDDAQIVNESLSKVYGDRPRVEIRVRPTALTCVRDLVMMGLAKPPRPAMPQVDWEQLSLVG
jgi:Holliday junction resolvase RusA-like endonuclease